MTTFLVTGGAGFIGSNFVHRAVAAGHSVVEPGCPELCRQSRQPDRARRPPSHVCPRFDRRPAAGEATAGPASAVRDRQLRRRDPCRPLDRRAGRVHQHQHQRHLRTAGGRAGALEGAAGRRARRLSLPSCLDRRGLRLDRDRQVHREQPLRSELALCRVEGLCRSPGARLQQHLRPADVGDELRQQLRAAAVSGKADPAHDPVRARPPAAAGLWRRQARARLAARRRSLRGADARHRGRPAGRNLQCRRLWRAAEPRRHPCDLRRAGAAPAERQLSRPHHLRDGPSGPRSPLCARRLEARARSGLEAGRRVRGRAPANRAWYLDNAPWCERIKSRGYQVARIGLGRTG